MMLFSAPASLPEVMIRVPSPLFGDTASPLLAIVSKRTMNNTQYTYVKNRGRSRLNYALMLTIGKQLELQEFVKRFLTDEWRITTHEREVWRVRLISEPVTFTQKDRNNRAQVQLSLEGVREYAPVFEC